MFRKDKEKEPKTKDEILDEKYLRISLLIAIGMGLVAGLVMVWFL